MTKKHGVNVDRQEAASAEVTRQCLDLRLAGGSLESIGRTVGLHKSNVSRRIKAALADIPAAEADALRTLENERLDAMQVAIWGKVRKGELGAVDRAIKISERRARLNGLDAPQRLDLGTKAVDIDAVARDIMDAATNREIMDGEEPGAAE